MNIIEALLSLKKYSIMCNIAKFHYDNLYNVQAIDLNSGVFANLRTTIYGYQNVLTEQNLTYACVIYRAGRIAIFAANGIDAISAGFSGCYMASFTLGNNRYVAHLAMDSQIGVKNSWNNAVNNNIINNVTLFCPSSGVYPSRRVGIWGIITKTNRCFRLEVNEVIINQKGHRILQGIPYDFSFSHVSNRLPIEGGLIP